MSDKRKVIFGYFVIVLLAMAITGMAVSVWAKPYTSAKDTEKAIVQAITDTTKTIIISDEANKAFADPCLVDTLAINTAFLRQMREKGELLSSNEFASRITDYYNTLVAVLTALFVLFTIVTYLTIKNQFESKFEDKANEIERNQRQKIIDELRNMLNDSKKIDEVITSAVGGHIDDQIASKEEIDDLSENLETNGKNLTALALDINEIRKKQSELFNVVEELQNQIAENAIVTEINDENKQENDNDDNYSAMQDAETT